MATEWRASRRARLTGNAAVSRIAPGPRTKQNATAATVGYEAQLWQMADAWVQHFIHHLAPTGLAGFVLANGSMATNQSGEGEIRKAIIEADRRRPAKIAGTYHAWRGDKDAGNYTDHYRLLQVGHARRPPEARPCPHAWALRRRRGAGGRRRAVCGEDEAAGRTLEEQFKESARLEAAIRANLNGLNFMP